MNLKHLYVGVNIAVIVLGGLVFGYWTFIDGVVNPVIDVHSDPMAIQTTQSVYHRGDVIYINYKFCKLRDIPVVTNWRLVDGEIILFSPVVKEVKVGCYGDSRPYTTSIIRIPMNTEYGTWHLEGEASFTVNPIKTVTFSRRTVDFQIVP